MIFLDSISKDNIRIKGSVEISSQLVIIAKISIFKAYKMLKDEFEDIRRNQSSILNIRNKRGSQRLNASTLSPFGNKSAVNPAGGRRKRGGIALSGLPGFPGAGRR